MALDQQYRKMLRDLMLGSDALSGQQTLPDGSIIGYDANTPDDMIAAVANPHPPMPEIQQQQIEQPKTPQRISDLLISQRPQDFGDQQRFDEAYQFKQQMPEGQSYLRNNTTGAVQTLPSGQRQPSAAAPGNAFNDLIRFGQVNSIDPATIGRLIKYQSSVQAGMPSAKDLYTASFKYNKPIGEMLDYYGAAAAGQSAQNAAQMQGEKDRLGLEKQRLELAQARGGGGSAYDNALAKGLADAQVKKVLAATPGTPEFERVQKESEAKRTMQERKLSAMESAESTLDAISNARKLIGITTTGLPGQILKNVGSTDALNLDEALQPVRASLAFDRLQQMRDESKTGGALGQVAVQELKMLQDSKASLNQAQSREQLERALNKIEGHYQRYWMAMSQARANGEFDNEAKQPSGAERQGREMFDKAKGVKRVIREVPLKDGRIGVEYSDGTRGFK